MVNAIINTEIRASNIFARINCITLFLNKNVVIIENAGISIIKIVRGKTFSIISEDCMTTSLDKPLNDSFIAEPDISAKLMILPRNKNTDKTVIMKRYKD
jgi:hypothetical protein